MSEGIKELKELLVAVNEVSLVLVKLLKDGIQLSDGMELVGKLVGDEEFKSKLAAAVEGITKLPAEIKDLDLQEGLELATVEIAFIPALVAALKA
jgi:hypothetical protein